MIHNHKREFKLQLNLLQKCLLLIFSGITQMKACSPLWRAARSATSHQMSKNKSDHQAMNCCSLQCICQQATGITNNSPGSSVHLVRQGVTQALGSSGSQRVHAQSAPAAATQDYGVQDTMAAQQLPIAQNAAAAKVDIPVPCVESGLKSMEGV